MKEKQKTLLELLKAMDSASIPFYEAKKSLLKQGYSEAEIAHALFEFSYDGKPDAPKRQDPVTTYYSKNPKEAKRVANYILKNSKRSGYGRTAANYLASQYAPSHHARSVYALRFADDIGFPFFTSIFLTAISILIVVIYDLPGEFAYVGVALVGVYWLGRKILDRF